VLTRATVEAYHASREPRADRRVLCHAPFVSLNFEQNGRVTACCYNRKFVLGTYPEQRLDEIWAGQAARELREAFLKDAEAPGCDLCFHQLKAGNLFGTLMRNFDRYSGGPGYTPELAVAAPRLLEFEISNTCNLECVMCSGNWSSTIRARREKLPPLRSPYDRAFVDQLQEFLPSLVSAKFLGGEPFLIERYYQIWESIRRLNPRLRFSITTNATVVPERARRLLEDLYADIVVSLDGMTAATYEAVRKNARFEEVMGNLEYFADYARRRGTSLSLAVCPMTHNWRELPLLFEFCRERQLDIYFNTVVRPVESSLAGLSQAELSGVIAHLERHRPPHGGGAKAAQNRGQWDGLLSQLRDWHEEKQRFARRCLELETRLRRFAAGNPAAEHGLPASSQHVLSSLALAFQLERERMAAPHADLCNILPATPLALWADGEAPQAREMLLAAHLLCRLPDAATDHQLATDDGTLLSERRRLERYLDWLATQRLDAMAELELWMRERLRQGEGDALIAWTRLLLGALDGDTVAALEFAHEMPRRLAGGLDVLRSQGLDESGCEKVAQYFERLVVGQLTKLPRVGSDRADASGPVLRSPPVRDFDDLSRLLDAVFLFHCHAKPTLDRAGFRRRLDSCLDQLSASGRTVAACQMLERSDLTTAYRYLANSSEDWLAHAIGSLA
jgi:MoaA/NifB/PqqE/SkfB family radical SAM enzyme